MVIFGSQYVPGRIPSTPHALPTIFCASVHPAPPLSTVIGVLKASDAPSPSDSRARLVRVRPMIKGMRPPACTSSRSTILLEKGLCPHSKSS